MYNWHFLANSLFPDGQRLSLRLAEFRRHFPSVLTVQSVVDTLDRFGNFNLKKSIDRFLAVLLVYRDAIPNSDDSPGERFHLWSCVAHEGVPTLVTSERPGARYEST